MENTNNREGGHAFSLPELKAKRNELKTSLEEVESAIEAFEKLVKSGVMSGQKNIHDVTLFDAVHKQNSYEDYSVYEGAVMILSKENQSLTTDEIVERLIAGGKKLGKNSRIIVATTLYKAVKQKKNCKIATAGKGKWKLA